MKDRNSTLFTPAFLSLCLCSFLFMGSFNMIIPELPEFLRNMGGEDHIGLIIAFFTMSAMISRPFSGKLTDLMGRRPVMVIGVVVSTVCCLIYPFFTTIFAFFFLRFLHGFSTGFQPTGVAAYLTDIVPAHRRGEAMGILGVSHSSGMAMGPVIGSAIANNFSMQAMFFTSAAIGVFALLSIFNLKETVAEPKPFNLRMLIVDRREIIEPRVLKPTLVMLLCVFPFGLILTIIPDLSVHLGIQNKGLYMSVVLVFSLVIRLFAGRASDRFGRINTILVGSVFLIISMIFTGAATESTMFLVAAGIYGIAVGIISPTIFAWVADDANEEHRGRAMSTMFIGLEIGIMLGATCSGYIYDNIAIRFPLVFLSAILASVLALTLLIALLYDKKELSVPD